MACDFFGLIGNKRKLVKCFWERNLVSSKGELLEESLSAELVCAYKACSRYSRFSIADMWWGSEPRYRQSKQAQTEQLLVLWSSVMSAIQPLHCLSIKS